MDIENIPSNNTSTKGAKKPSSKSRNIEKIYQKKTQLEHILLRPDTYVGSVEKITQPMWVWDDTKKRMVNRPVTYVPGLYKIFDEIIVNAADNKQRDAAMNRIEVEFDQAEGLISVWNNGKGVPVVIHQEHNVYVPELIFGHLLTGSNFDDNQKKTTGGRNGYGAKLANVFSTEFTVETADSMEGKKYIQVFSNNMGNKSTPRITSSSKDYTKISFRPDLGRFGMDRLDDDIVALLSKRTIDMAGVTSGVKVYLNGTRIPVSNFSQYCDLYSFSGPAASAAVDGDGAPPAPVKLMERVNERWEVGVGISDGSFQQISFVNSISTTKGGQHVNAIADQVAARLIAVSKRKNKGVELKPAHVKNHLCIYVKALIENPAFDSQTKEFCTTRASAFGSSCTLSDKFLKQVEKCGVIDNILAWAKFKQTAELRRKTGPKKSKLTGVPKLDDANDAGGAKGSDCTLILTEGDSAKALAVSGLGVVGRDKYGVFPLKGKLLNVREASHAQIMKNDEIQNIVKILGLKFGEVYTTTRGLRYGHLMIMTDQDHDGSHIKGLLINFIHHFWPSLLNLDGFLQQFITPIVKLTKGKRVETFYTLPEYEAWIEEVDEDGSNSSKKWTVKYYKGLGTSSAKEAKEYFSDLDKHQIDFRMGDSAESDLIDMAFSKKRVEERKTWLRQFQIGTYVDYGVETMSYTNFINKELILFSVADNMRSIPSVMDGFKPSQRKVLFSCFKRKLKSEIKVAQLSGYVSEHSAYHHGEMSLTGTIIGMAQDFVGSNNVELLFPSGQFGTRLMGGKDAASPRYVFTKLSTITRSIFHIDDDALMNFQEEDGQVIEPDFYVPIIPMVLVNGADGIGTGWSSSVPTYNPRDLIKNIMRLMQGEEMEPIHPWYRGFTGTVTPKSTNGSYLVSGRFERLDDHTILINELPVRSWTQPYKQFLETFLVGATGADAGLIKDFRENHTDTTVSFTVTFVPERMLELEASPGGIMKKFKLETSVSTTNMMLFDQSYAIRKYDSPLQIISTFFSARRELYEKRKSMLLGKLGDDVCKLSNKVRFILAVVRGELVVSNRKKQELMAQMQADGYALIQPASKKGGASPGEDAEEGGGEEDEEGEASAADLSKGYDYLLSMKLWSLTMEKVEELVAQLKEKEAEMAELEGTTPEQLWCHDLEVLEDALDESDAIRADLAEEDAVAMRRAKNKNKGGKGKKGGRAAAAKKGAAARTKKKKAVGSGEESDDDFEEDDDSDYESAKTKKKPAARKPAAAPKVAPAAAVAAPAPAAAKAGKAKKLLPKTEPVSKAKPKTKAPPPPARSSPEVQMVEGDEEDSEEEIETLAQRLARRMEVTPRREREARERAKAAAAGGDSGEDDEELVLVKPKATGRGAGAAAGGAAKPKPKAKAPTKRSKKVLSESESEEEDEEEASYDDDEESEEEDDYVEPAPKKAVKKQPVKAKPAPTAAAKPRGKPAAAAVKAKPAASRGGGKATKAKTTAAANPFAFLDGPEDVPPAPPVAASARAGRARKPVQYVEEVESEEEEEEEVEEMEEEDDSEEEEEGSDEDFEFREEAVEPKAKPPARGGKAKAAGAASKAKAAVKPKVAPARKPPAPAASGAKANGKKRLKSPKAPAQPAAKAGRGKGKAPAAAASSPGGVTPYPEKKKRKMKGMQRVEESSEEEESEDIQEIRVKTPKPSRARTKVSYKVESEEEEEESDEYEEEDDESDFEDDE